MRILAYAIVIISAIGFVMYCREAIGDTSEWRDIDD